MASNSPKLCFKSLKNTVNSGSNSNKNYGIIANSKNESLVPLPPPLLSNHIITNNATNSSSSTSSTSSSSSSSSSDNPTTLNSFPFIQFKNNLNKMQRNDYLTIHDDVDVDDGPTPLTTEEEFKK